MRLACFALALLVLAAPASARQPAAHGPTRIGADAAANPAEAMKDGFAVLLLTTDDPEAFYTAWAGPTPPNLPTTARVARETPVQAMLIFSGCRAGRDGNCNVTARFSVTAPDGSPSDEPVEAQVWSRPPAPGRNLHLSEGALGFVLEPGDPLGVYTFAAAVTDRVAGTTVEVRTSVTVSED